MPELKELSIEQYDTEIAACRREVAKHDSQLAEIRATLAQLATHPGIRAQSLQDLESQLTKTRLALEIALEQSKMYKGTEIEEAMTKDAVQAVARLKQKEKQLEETRQKNQEQDAADEAKRQELQLQQQHILPRRHNLQDILARKEQERSELHMAGGKAVYQAGLADYRKLQRKASIQERDREQAYQEIEVFHNAFLNRLEPYPDLQRLFVQEHHIAPSDGPLRVAVSAIKYLEALIADHLSLEQTTTEDGRPLFEILALTDQEILAQYQGGLYNLQEKRAQLLDFVEQRKATLTE